jgi:hypothetical protein
MGHLTPFVETRGSAVVQRLSSRQVKAVLPCERCLGLIRTHSSRVRRVASGNLLCRKDRWTEGFDFRMGRWRVHHRILRGRLTGSTSWEECEGTAIQRPILSGLGNSDEYVIERASGRREGLAIRLFDPASQEWSIYWAEDIHSGRVYGRLGDPAIGHFTNGRGEFHSHDPYDSRRIYCRIVWFGDHRHLVPLGAGVLSGWRKNLGNELDHGLHQTGGVATQGVPAASTPAPRTGRIRRGEHGRGKRRRAPAWPRAGGVGRRRHARLARVSASGGGQWGVDSAAHATTWRHLPYRDVTSLLRHVLLGVSRLSACRE